jgi:16S rRNA (uracil1498-N3)-methyltransferase
MWLEPLEWESFRRLSTLAEALPTASLRCFSDQSVAMITLRIGYDNNSLPARRKRPIIPAVVRRFHVPALSVGEIELAPAQARHLRDVLRLRPGDLVEAFDDAGAVAQATVLTATARGVTLRVGPIEPADVGWGWTVAAAVPKGPRADWMVEKLAELGTGRFIPLIAARSVTLPGGREKIGRWSRLAAQASRQSGRRGVMRIDDLTPLAEVIASIGPGRAGWHLSTHPDATPAAKLLSSPRPAALVMLIGPEGGWTDEESEALRAAGLVAVKLARTTLRVETAAVAAAALAAAWEDS